MIYRYIEGYFPTNTCNLKCEYCFLSHLPEHFRETASKPLYSPEHIANCLRPERLGGTCIIFLGAEGETLLLPDLTELCRLLMEQGHCVSIVTNLTVTKVLNRLLELPDELLSRLFFKVSLHYKELKRKGLLETFWSNLDLVQKSACSFTLELMSGDGQIPLIPEIIEECEAHVGAKCHVTVGRRENDRARRVLTEHALEEYQAAWSVFDSELFRFKMDLYGKRRREFCYAGDYTLYVNMHTGEAHSCYAQPDSRNIFSDPNRPIHFHAVGCHCAEPFCFNGHANLAFGCIPELDAPTYFTLRNRVRPDGSEWLRGEIRGAFSEKISDNRKPYSKARMLFSNLAWYARAVWFVVTHPKRTLHHLTVRS